jgi:hypothetical protein
MPALLLAAAEPSSLPILWTGIQVACLLFTLAVLFYFFRFARAWILRHVASNEEAAIKARIAAAKALSELTSVTQDQARSGIAWKTEQARLHASFEAERSALRKQAEDLARERDTLSLRLSESEDRNRRMTADLPTLTSAPPSTLSPEAIADVLAARFPHILAAHAPSVAAPSDSGSLLSGITTILAPVHQRLDSLDARVSDLHAQANATPTHVRDLVNSLRSDLTAIAKQIPSSPVPEFTRLLGTHTKALTAEIASLRSATALPTPAPTPAHPPTNPSPASVEPLSTQVLSAAMQAMQQDAAMGPMPTLEHRAGELTTSIGHPSPPPTRLTTPVRPPPGDVPSLPTASEATPPSDDQSVSTDLPTPAPPPVTALPVETDPVAPASVLPIADDPGPSASASPAAGSSDLVAPDAVSTPAPDPRDSGLGHCETSDSFAVVDTPPAPTVTDTTTLGVVEEEQPPTPVPEPPAPPHDPRPPAADAGSAAVPQAPVPASTPAAKRRPRIL